MVFLAHQHGPDIECMKRYEENDGSEVPFRKMSSQPQSSIGTVHTVDEFVEGIVFYCLLSTIGHWHTFAQLKRTGW